MMRSRTLYRSPLVSLVRLDHPPGHLHSDPKEEIGAHHAVSFIERGDFDLMQGKARWRMGPETILVTHPGLVYRCEHPAACPDDVSLSVRFAPDLVDDVQASDGRRWRRGAPVARLTNRLAFLRHRLIEAAAGGDEPMAAVSVAGELLSALDDGRSLDTRLFRASQLDWYARRIDDARRRMSEQFAEPHTLESTARDAGMSPFHFSRVFRELVGVPPHRYLRQTRLARAAELLREGAGVTETCLATGFGNLSHFVRSFRRAYGVAPSRYGR